MNHSIIPHSFNGKTISQLSQDTIIHGVLIPAGFCNLTEMVKASDKPGKRLNDYLSNKSTKEYLDGLKAEILATHTAGISADLVVTVVDDKGLTWGTWADVEIAIDCAKWISVPFRIWANRVLRLITQGDYQALTEEAAIAQAELQKQWQKIRDGSKEAFWALSDAVKDYKNAHPEKSENYRTFVYSNCQDAINRGLFGKAAAAIREELGVSNLLRDHYGQTALKRIELIQSLAAANIIHRNVEPLDAVKSALEMYSFEVIDYKD